jgi:hypothetical protein
MILAATSVKVFMFVTFLSTGSEVKYQFDTLANCNAAKPPVVQLYKSLGDKVNVSCKEIARS